MSQKKKSNKLPATINELAMYSTLGAGFLCKELELGQEFFTNDENDKDNAEKRLEFNKKALFIPCSTITDAIVGLHDSCILDENNKEITMEEKQLFKMNEMNILGKAINMCDYLIADELKNAFTKTIARKNANEESFW